MLNELLLLKLKISVFGVDDKSDEDIKSGTLSEVETLEEEREPSPRKQGYVISYKFNSIPSLVGESI